MIKEYEIDLKTGTIISAFLKIYFDKDNYKYLEEYFSKEYNKKALAVGSGSDAIFIILKDIQRKIGFGEIICSAYGCKAIPRSIIKAGFKPVFVDVDKSLSLDITLVKKAISKETKAILIYHPWGFPHNKNIFDYCKKNKIVCIEDCAKGFGRCPDGKRLGSFGDYSFFSFRTGKLLHSGSGSVIISKQEINIHLGQYPKILSLANMADLLFRKILNVSKPKAIFDYLFENIDSKKIGNSEAWLVLKQIRDLESISEKRIKNYKHLIRILAKTKFETIKFLPGETIPLSLPILIDNRKLFSNLLKKCGIDTREYYTHTNHEEFCQFKRFLNGKSKDVAEKIINIPLHEGLDDGKINKICEAITYADRKING